VFSVPSVVPFLLCDSAVNLLLCARRDSAVHLLDPAVPPRSPYRPGRTRRLVMIVLGADAK
jgi:hypothetical protein